MALGPVGDLMHMQWSVLIMYTRWYWNTYRVRWCATRPLLSTWTGQPWQVHPTVWPHSTGLHPGRPW